MTVSSQPLQISGEILQPPALKFFFPAQETPVNGVWNVMRKNLFIPCQLGKWAIVDLSGRNDSDGARARFLVELEKCLRSLGAVDSFGLVVFIVTKYPVRNEP
jgi:hypothetical protein